MRIPSGSTDRKIYFVAVDATDLKTRETGLSSFTVVRSRDGAADVTYTTPTVAEIDASTMPGVYALTLDEDTTVASGHDTEEYCLHITQASMAPVTRVIELYRVKFTEGQTATMANSAVDADLERVAGTVVTASGGRPEVNTSHVAGTAQTAGDIIADTNDIQARLPAALVSGRIDASVGAMAAGVVTAAAVATGAIDADAVAADAVTEIQAGLSTLDAAGVRAAVGLASANLDTQLTAIDDAVDTEVAAILAAVDTEVGAIKAKTDNLPASPAATGDAMTLTVGERAAVADKLLGRTRAGGADGGRTVAECLAFGRNKWAISAGVLTVYADDDTTPLYTAAVTTAAGDPVTSVDPV